jgi:hypothetical protein
MRRIASAASHHQDAPCCHPLVECRAVARSEARSGNRQPSRGAFKGRTPSSALSYLPASPLLRCPSMWLTRSPAQSASARERPYVTWPTKVVRGACVKCCSRHAVGQLPCSRAPRKQAACSTPLDRPVFVHATWSCVGTRRPLCSSPPRRHVACILSNSLLNTWCNRHAWQGI